MKAYADTNFIVRLYLELPGAEEAQKLSRRSGHEAANRLILTWLTQVEVLNAFERFVFESRTGGQFRVTPEAAAAAHASFASDIASSVLYQLAVPPVPDLANAFKDIALRHTARHGFRTYDILHVASALVLDCDAFWSFDAKAKKLANLEGLPTN